MKRYLLNSNLAVLRLIHNNWIIGGLCLLFLLFLSPLHATNYYSRASGSYSSTSLWSTVACGGASCTCTPTPASTVEICAGNTVTYTGSYNLTGSLDVYGTLIITDSLNISGNLTIETGATLIVDGDVTNQQHGNGSGAPVVNGTFTVGGNLDDGGNSQFLKGTGSLSVAGSIYGSGSLFGISPITCSDCSVTSSGGVVVLPVSLISFTAVYNNDVVILQWLTAVEIDNKYFSIERTTDGENYTEIATINGAGNTSVQHNYEYIDPTPVSGISYYRLKQTDYDGSYAYLGIDPVNVDVSDNEVKIIPNPVKNNCVVSFYDNAIENVQLSVYDYTGREVSSKNISTVNGSNAFLIDVSSLPSGMYFISVPLSHTALKAKFIKN